MSLLFNMLSKLVITFLPRSKNQLYIYIYLLFFEHCFSFSYSNANKGFPDSRITHNCNFGLYIVFNENLHKCYWNLKSILKETTRKQRIMGSMYVERFSGLWWTIIVFSVLWSINDLWGKKKKLLLRFITHFPTFLVLFCFVKFSWRLPILGKYCTFSLLQIGWKEWKRGYYQLVSTFCWSALGI